MADPGGRRLAEFHVAEREQREHPLPVEPAPAEPVQAAQEAPPQGRASSAYAKAKAWTQTRPAKVLGWIFVVLLVAPAILYTVPQLAGSDDAFVVLSGSMVPFFEPGDIIFTHETAPDTLQVGDVVTFSITPGSTTLITHRVIEVIDTGGVIRYRTQGDANEDPDPFIVKQEMVVGTYDFQIKYWGLLLATIRSKWGYFFLVLLPAAAVIIHEFTKLYRELDEADRAKKAKKLAEAKAEPSPATIAEQGPAESSSNWRSKTIVRRLMRVFGCCIAILALTSAVGQSPVDLAATLSAPLFPHASIAATWAVFSDTESANGEIMADFPVGTGCVFWANSTTAPHALHIRGARHTFEGCLHSNADLELAGNNHLLYNTLRHAGAFDSNENSHDVREGNVSVPAEPYPFPFRFDDYAPGGRAAVQAQLDNAYYVYTGHVKLDDSLLKEGLHFVQGSATVTVTDATLNVTVVASGRLAWFGSESRLDYYTDGLLFYSNSNATNAMDLKGAYNELTGAVYAPTGGVSFAGKYETYRGQVVGDTIDLAGQDTRFIARNPVRLQSPGATTQTTIHVAPVPVSPVSVPSELVTRPARDLLDDATEPLPVFAGMGDFDDDGRTDITVGSAEADFVVVISEASVRVPWELLP